MQTDLDAWLDEYNRTRPHSGKYCYGKPPMQTFVDSLSLAREKMLDASYEPAAEQITTNQLLCEGRGERFFLPVKVLAVVFRGKFLDALERAFHKHKLTLAGQLTPLQSPPVFAALLRTAAQRDWVVYAKRPFAGPAQVLAYLSRYTHRIAIANSRLLSMIDGKVTFRWRDYAHGYQSRTMTLEADEFLRRFLLHVLPIGFVRIRYFGMLANRQRKLFLNLCRDYLQLSLPRQLTTGVVHLCQHCHRGTMRLIEVLSPTRLSTWLADAPQPENSS